MSRPLYVKPNKTDADVCKDYKDTETTIVQKMSINDSGSPVPVAVPLDKIVKNIDYFIIVPCNQYLKITYSDDTSTYVHGPYKGNISEISKDLNIKSFTAVKYSDESIMTLITSPDFWKKEVMIKGFWVNSDNKPTTNSFIMGGLVVLLLVLMMMVMKKNNPS